MLMPRFIEARAGRKGLPELLQRFPALKPVGRHPEQRGLGVVRFGASASRLTAFCAAANPFSSHCDRSAGTSDAFLPYDAARYACAGLNSEIERGRLFEQRDRLVDILLIVAKGCERPRRYRS